MLGDTAPPDAGLHSNFDVKSHSRVKLSKSEIISSDQMLHTGPQTKNRTRGRVIPYLNEEEGKNEIPIPKLMIVSIPQSRIIDFEEKKNVLRIDEETVGTKILTNLEHHKRIQPRIVATNDVEFAECKKVAKSSPILYFCAQFPGRIYNLWAHPGATDKQSFHRNSVTNTFTLLQLFCQPHASPTGPVIFLRQINMFLKLLRFLLSRIRERYNWQNFLNLFWSSSVLSTRC